jgi:hypothetical protein
MATVETPAFRPGFQTGVSFTMNRTIKEAAVKCFHYQSYGPLKAHLQTFLMAYNFARRLKALKNLTPCEFI